MSNQPIITNATGATQPDQTLFIEQKAKEIVDGLTPSELAYAISPERGEYFGFAALHDLFDANELLPGISTGGELDFATDNAVIKEVNLLLRGRVNLQQPERAQVRAILPEFNIPAEVLSEACTYATLSETSTGGGCDYVTREVSPGRTLVLMAVGDGVSPATLAQPATVTLFLNPDWDESLSFEFDSTAVAIAFMAAPTKTGHFKQ